MFSLDSKLLYKGDKRPSHRESVEKGIYPYIPSENLKKAVNLTVFLEKRPLLLVGEPGCGKTRLAEMVAYELDLPYEPWYIKSTSRAKDGLYVYDSLRRLQDAQLGNTDEQAREDAKNPINYVKWGPLGRAFRNEKRTVVLIDEIDKADIDFPNDLLRELDEQKFTLEEVFEEDKNSQLRNKVIKANQPPIVFITSNREKDLPEAFLRRCLFHHIEFPDKSTLIKIVNDHFPDASDSLIQVAVDRFAELRGKMDQDKGSLDKKVSTSELLDWFRVLYHCPDIEELLQAGKSIPFPEVLLKSIEDIQRYLPKTPIDEEES